MGVKVQQKETRDVTSASSRRVVATCSSTEDDFWGIFGNLKACDMRFIGEASHGAIYKLKLRPLSGRMSYQHHRDDQCHVRGPDRFRHIGTTAASAIVVWRLKSRDVDGFDNGLGGSPNVVREALSLTCMIGYSWAKAKGHGHRGVFRNPAFPRRIVVDTLSLKRQQEG